MSTSDGTFSAYNSHKGPREHQSDPMVTIYVHDLKEGRQSKYKIKSSAPMKHLLEQHCKDNNLDYRTVKFTHNGKRLHTTKSAAQLGLEDDNIIESFVQTNGG